MSAKKSGNSKNNVVWHLSCEQATLAKKPLYNGHACGHGVHGDTKYNRKKEKAKTRKLLDQERAPRGSFLIRATSILL